MSTRDTMDMILEDIGMEQREAAKFLDLTPKMLNDRIVREVFRLSEFFRLIKKLDISIVYVEKGGVRKLRRVKRQKLCTQTPYYGQCISAHPVQIKSTYTVSGDLKRIYQRTRCTDIRAGVLTGLGTSLYKGRIERKTIRYADLARLLDKLGYEIEFYHNGRKLYHRQGDNVVKVIDKVRYNTSTCTPICNTFYQDGQNKFTDGKAMELYAANTDEYVLAYFFDDPTIKPQLIKVDEKTASTFIERYSTTYPSTKHHTYKKKNSR